VHSRLLDEKSVTSSQFSTWLTIYWLKIHR